MNFLAPLFLLGGLAVALPIVFHLIRRTSREKQPFSTLMFLAPTPPRLTKRSRLENLWLLLLRCLILACLALGFARPYLMRPVASTESGKASRQVVVLVDTSASMRRGTLWEAAVARAKQVVGRLEPGDRVAVAAFDRTLRPLLSFQESLGLTPEARNVRLSELLGSLKPTWFGTFAGDALIEAAQMFNLLEDRSNIRIVRQVVLVGDLQEGSHLDRLQGYEWPKDVRLVLERVNAAGLANAGVSPIEESPESQSDATNAVIRVRVANAADSKKEQFKVQWAAPASASSTDVYVPPGQSRVVTTPALAAGSQGEKVVLSGDDADFDNAAYFARAEAEQIEIVYLGGEPDTDTSQQLYYIRRAFQSTRRQAVKISGYEPMKAAGFLKSGGASVLIVADTPNAEQVAFIREFLKAGRTVVCTLKAGGSLQWLAETAEATPPTVSEASLPSYAMLGEIDFQHPFFASFADPRYSDFTKIHFWKHRSVDARSLPKGARVVARFDGGDPAIIDLSFGGGRVALFAFSWVPADSQFVLSSKFVPLLYALLENGRGGSLLGHSYQVGQALPWPGDSTGAVAALKITRPDGREVDWPKGSTFAGTDEPGVYVVNGLERPFRFAVNLDPAESKTNPLDADAFGSLGVPVNTSPTDSSSAAPGEKKLLPAQMLETRQKAWRWFIVTATLLLLSESLLAGWVTRRNAAVTV